MKSQVSGRREFLKQGALGATGALLAPSFLAAAADTDAAKPALLGGKPLRTASFSRWPQLHDGDNAAWQEVLEARGWCRLNGKNVSNFEEVYAELLGARHCLATANGTSALIASLNGVGVGAGDEVLVPPYTFVATVNAVLLQHALPVFVDTDRETFQMDAEKAEAAITGETRCMIPVHLGGNAPDMDKFMSISEARDIPVIEDACQSHLGEWRGKCFGTVGKTGCFSFQVTKNLSGGEGGAVLTDDEDLFKDMFSFHTNGRPWDRSIGFNYTRNGTNIRMTEFQGCLLLRQLLHLEAQSQTREQNAAYLTSMLGEIPGIYPAKMHEGCTRNAYHLYMFRLDSEAFDGLGRDRFLEALRAEGIPCSPGYAPLTKEPFLRRALESRGFQRVFGEQRIKQYFDELACPENDRLCGEAVWFTQNMLIGPRSDMDEIAGAITKIRQHAKDLIA